VKDYRELWDDLVRGHFPHIKAVNASGPDWQNGTPYTADFIDDIWGFFQAVMGETGIMPSGESEAAHSSQILEALRLIFKSADEVINIATLVKAGLIKSSDAPGKVSIGFDGTGTANGLPELFPDQEEQWRIINLLVARLENVNNGLFTDITTNPFLVTFESLDGLEIISGVWNEALARVEC